MRLLLYRLHQGGIVLIITVVLLRASDAHRALRPCRRRGSAGGIALRRGGQRRGQRRRGRVRDCRRVRPVLSTYSNRTLTRIAPQPQVSVAFGSSLDSKRG